MVAQDEQTGEDPHKQIKALILLQMQHMNAEAEAMVSLDVVICRITSWCFCAGAEGISHSIIYSIIYSIIMAGNCKITPT